MCSSDLQAPEIVKVFVELSLVVELLEQGAAKKDGDAEILEIGRASCRERV